MKRTQRSVAELVIPLLLAVSLAGCLGAANGPSTSLGGGEAGSSGGGDGGNVTDTFSGTWHWPGTPNQERTGDDGIGLLNRSGTDAFNLTLTFRWTDPTNVTEWEFDVNYGGNWSGNFSCPPNASCLGPADCLHSWNLEGSSPLVLQVNSSHQAFQDDEPVETDPTCHWDGGGLWLHLHKYSGWPANAHRRIDWRAVVEYG